MAVQRPKLSSIIDQSYFKDDDPDVVDPQAHCAVGYIYGTHYFRFAALNRLTQAHTAASASTTKLEKPYNDHPTRESHNAHQRAVWQKIWDEAKEDGSIPTALFDPPRTYIEVRVAKWPISGPYCCACAIIEDECEIIQIRAPKDSPDGITKEMFVQQVSEALYGRGSAAKENGGGDGYKIGGEDDRPVIEKFDYMILESYPENEISIMKHIFALTKGIEPKKLA